MPVLPGLAAEWRVRPGPSDTAAALGNVGVAVVATPVLIGWLEQASHLAIAPCYEAGETSVGTAVEIEHLAAAEQRRLGHTLDALDRCDGGDVGRQQDAQRQG